MSASWTQAALISGLSSIKIISSCIDCLVFPCFPQYVDPVGPVWLTLPQMPCKPTSPAFVTGTCTPKDFALGLIIVAIEFAILHSPWFSCSTVPGDSQQGPSTTGFWNSSLQIPHIHIEPAAHVRSGSEIHGVYFIIVHCLSWFNIVFFCFSSSICWLQRGWRPRGQAWYQPEFVCFCIFCILLSQTFACQLICRRSGTSWY